MSGVRCCTFWKIDGNLFKSTNTILWFWIKLRFCTNMGIYWPQIQPPVKLLAKSKFMEISVYTKIMTCTVLHVCQTRLCVCVCVWLVLPHVLVYNLLNVYLSMISYSCLWKNNGRQTYHSWLSHRLGYLTFRISDEWN